MSKSALLGLVVLGCSGFLRAQDPVAPAPVPAPPEPEIQDNDTSPLHLALLAYKSGKYEEARAAIDVAEKAKPGDLTTELLKAKILTEQHDFADGEKLLRSLLSGNPVQLTPQGMLEVQTALGDLLLRKRSFDRAAKYYTAALQAKPNDPDLTLKLVYCKIGVSDFVAAGQYASHLTPLDPKNPYDTHASYYFAKAALAQATGKTAEADDEIQTARTDYGITVTNHYLKTYLEFFTPADKTPASDLTPPPLLKNSQAK